MSTPRSLCNPAGRAAILDRIARLSPQHQRRWGKMRPEHMLPHLCEALRLALGERKLTGKNKHGLSAWLFRSLAIHRLPWPEGKIRAPSGVFDMPSDGFEQDRVKLVGLIERFAATPPEQLGTEHPSFGRMRHKDWDVLQYRHIDHHLRQFGG